MCGRSLVWSRTSSPLVLLVTCKPATLTTRVQISATAPKSWLKSIEICTIHVCNLLQRYHLMRKHPSNIAYPTFLIQAEKLEPLRRSGTKVFSVFLLSLYYLSRIFLRHLTICRCRGYRLDTLTQHS